MKRDRETFCFSDKLHKVSVNMKLHSIVFIIKQFNVSVFCIKKSSFDQNAARIGSFQHVIRCDFIKTKQKPEQCTSMTFDPSCGDLILFLIVFILLHVGVSFLYKQRLLCFT